MKILEIIPQLSSGGAERFVVDLCNELSKSNNVVLVVLHRIDKYGFYKNEIKSSVRVISLNKKMGADISILFRLYKLIKKENPDIVHTHLNAIVYSLLAWFKLKKINFVDTIHNDAAREAGKGPNKWIRKFAFKSCRVYPITISKESQNSFLRFYNCKSSLILNGRPAYDFSKDISSVEEELSAFRCGTNTKLIINVARVMEPKNQINLAKAIERINQEGTSIELIIVGRYESDNPICAQLHNFRHTHLLGQRSNPRDYMRVADAFCLSSLYEGMPITLIECFSVGALPLCTPVGGIKNMISDGENGLLAKGTRIDDIYELLIRFCRLSKVEIDKIRQKSLESFSMYDISICAKNYLDLFEHLN